MATILEGTWEEIKSHDAELTGRHLKVIIDVDQPAGIQLDIQQRLVAWSEFVANGVNGPVVDDTREAIYSDDRG